MGRVLVSTFYFKEDTHVMFPDNGVPFLRRNGVRYDYMSFPRTIVIGDERVPYTVTSPEHLRTVLIENGYGVVSLSG
jgi:hypothetical protein